MIKASRSVTTLVPPMVVKERLAQRDTQRAIVTLWYDIVSETHFVTAYEPGRHFRVQAAESQRTAAQTVFEATEQLYRKAGFTLGRCTLPAKRRERLLEHLTAHHAFAEQRARITV